MLMGAVANQAPELFAGFIGEVPFVDVMNTMSDATLPLTPPEWVEWGNPITSPEDYAIMSEDQEQQLIGGAPPATTKPNEEPRLTRFTCLKVVSMFPDESGTGTCTIAVALVPSNKPFCR